MTFFRGFTLDTLLGCISCVLGVVALFIGTKVYKKYKFVETSMDDHKVFNDNSADHSQRVVGSIINNNCDVNAITSMTVTNFESCLKMAYSAFDRQAKTNLQKIIEQTKQIIQEQKPNIAGLTKIDWINVYFESAKNTSDEYMQDVWAKILAKELECPGYFSYKTLDVLKNMSSEEFHSFETLGSLQMEGWILQEDLYSNYGISYVELVKLSEHGLLNMGLTQNTYEIEAHKALNLIYQTLLIRLENESNEKTSIRNNIYLLSTAAKELIAVANISLEEDYAKDCVSTFSEHNRQLKVTLHRINYLNGNEVNYQSEDLCSKKA